MKLKFIFTAIFLLSASFISAETVILCIDDNSPAIEREDWPVTVARCFEDGIMDVFFEQGHIITNVLLNQLDESKTADFAKECGAGLVLRVRVIYPSEIGENLPVPEKAEYTLSDDNGKNILSTEELWLDELNSDIARDILDVFTLAGKIIGEHAVSGI